MDSNYWFNRNVDDNLHNTTNNNNNHHTHTREIYALNQNLKILGAHSLWMNQQNGEVKQHNGCMLQPLPERHPSKLMIIHIHQIPTEDGCEILHHQPDGWNPINNGINYRFQLVINGFLPPSNPYVFAIKAHSFSPYPRDISAPEKLRHCIKHQSASKNGPTMLTPGYLYTGNDQQFAIENGPLITYRILLLAVYTLW